jgi:hypothetical protein
MSPVLPFASQAQEQNTCAPLMMVRKLGKPQGCIPGSDRIAAVASGSA